MSATYPADSHGIPSATPNAVRPMYWTVRRELWENRSIYLAPLAVIAIVLFAFFISTFSLPKRMRNLPALDPVRQHETVTKPFSVAAGLTITITFLVGVFYCLDALHGERRDRSILFWKSLPVSDRTAVFAKASIPLAVLPLLSFAIIILAQLTMLVMSSVILQISGVGAGAMWTRLPFFQMTLVLIHSLVAIALWHAPIYAWLLLVSGWARRMVILWAVVPFLAAGAFERIAFGTSFIGLFMRSRLIGWYTQSLDFKAPGSKLSEPLTLLTTGTFLSSPGLWLGLAFAAAFIAAAVRLRRNREPM